MSSVADTLCLQRSFRFSFEGLGLKSSVRKVLWESPKFPKVVPKVPKKNLFWAKLLGNSMACVA